MATPRQHHAAVVGPDGKVYALGGHHLGDANDPDGGAWASVEAYTPKSNRWAAAPSLNVARTGLAAVTVGQQIYVLGGNGDDGVALNSVEVWSPGAKRRGGWSVLAKGMPTARTNLVAATDQAGRIYAIGGFDRNGMIVNNVERYDPGTGAWETLIPMATPRSALVAHNSTASGRLRIYAIGGSGGSSVNEAYDPELGTWTPASPMPTGRFGLGAARTPDGRIFAIGGHSGTGTIGTNEVYIKTVEVYDPKANTWTTVTPLNRGREGVAAAAANGRIYAIGGYSCPKPGTPDDCPGVLASVEAYTP